MPTDVSGTINIIAEVVGNSTSPVAGTGSVTQGQDKKDQKENKGWIKDLWKSSKKMMAILGIGGLLASSKIISGTMGAIMRIFGTFMDILIMPIVPLLVRGLVILATVVMWVRKLLTGGAAWSDAWAGLKNWWTTTWDEKGGLWGIIKEALLTVTGAALIGALFLSIVAGPMAGAWLMKQFIGSGTFITKHAMRKALGLLKFSVTAPFRIAKWAGTNLWRAMPMLAKRPFITAASLVKKLFAKGAIFAKDVLRRAIGLISWGLQAGKAALRMGLSAVLWGGQVAKVGIGWLMTKLGLGGLFGGVGAALGALWLPALIGLLIIGAAVSAWFVWKYIVEKVFGRSLESGLAVMNRAWDDPAFAEEAGVYRPPILDNASGFNAFQYYVQGAGAMSVGADPSASSWVIGFFTSLRSQAEVPETTTAGE
jgi:hypothetical protein